jgi:hypothetical protein
VSSTTPNTSPLPSDLSVPASVPHSATPVVADAARIAEAHRYVLQWTERVFGCPGSIQETNDPETGTLFYVVEVRAAGTVDELVAKWQQWHSEPMPVLTPFGSNYCLHLVPVQ